MYVWIESALASLTASVHEEMGAYRLYAVVPKLLDFMSSLSDWYARLNRHCLKGNETEEDRRATLGTLAHVLLSLSKLMAPFAPIFAEFTYSNLKPFAPEELIYAPVHFLMLP